MQNKMSFINSIKLVFSILIYTFFSCKGNPKQDIYKDHLLKIIYILPDTININQKLNGQILYKSEFDTINLVEDESRYVFLYINVNDYITKNYTDFLKQPHDTFVPKKGGHNLFNIENIVFNKEGKQYIDGYFVDEVWLKRNSFNDEFKVPMIKTKFFHSIVVLDTVVSDKTF